MPADYKGEEFPQPVIKEFSSHHWHGPVMSIRLSTKEHFSVKSIFSLSLLIATTVANSSIIPENIMMIPYGNNKTLMEMIKLKTKKMGTHR
jgi:hypothetical protein